MNSGKAGSDAEVSGRIALRKGLRKKRLSLASVSCPAPAGQEKRVGLTVANVIIANVTRKDIAVMGKMDMMLKSSSKEGITVLF